MVRGLMFYVSNSYWAIAQAAGTRVDLIDSQAVKLAQEASIQLAVIVPFLGVVQNAEKLNCCIPDFKTALYRPRLCRSESRALGPIWSLPREASSWTALSPPRRLLRG